MKIWKKLALISLACLATGVGVLTATGCEEPKKNELKYYLSEDGKHYIVGGIGTYQGETLEIPKTYKGLPVQEIFDRAFYDCDQFKSVVIPDHITKMGFGVFENCDGIEKAVIGDGVDEVPSAAFAGCKNLFSVTLGDQIHNIVVDAFEGCTRLVEVYNYSRLDLEAGRKGYGNVAYYAKDVYTDNAVSRVVTNRDGFVLHSDGEVVSLIAYVGSQSEITMPEKVTVINDYAFDSTDVLQKVTINGKVHTVGSYAFIDCDRLQSVLMSASVTTVEEGAFYNCDRLTEVSIGENVATIGVKAFAGSDGLENIVIPDNVTALGQEAFFNCLGLKTVKLGKGLSVVEEKTFADCTALESVEFGEGINRICKKAFEGCEGFKSAVFAKTTVWWVADGPYETSGLLVTKEVMESAISAAYYLKGEYKDRYWNRLDGDVENEQA